MVLPSISNCTGCPKNIDNYQLIDNEERELKRHGNTYISLKFFLCIHEMIFILYHLYKRRQLRNEKAIVEVYCSVEQLLQG